MRMEDVVFVVVFPGEGHTGRRGLAEEDGQDEMNLAHHGFFDGGNGGGGGGAGDGAQLEGSFAEFGRNDVVHGSAIPGVVSVGIERLGNETVFVD